MIGVCSLRGSPGASVLAALLATAVDGRAMLVEADPDGGVAAIRFGLSVEPGLVSAASRARHGLDADELSRHLQRSGDIDVLGGPRSGDQAVVALSEAGAALAAVLAGLNRPVVVDLGRLSSRSPALAIAGACSAVLVVCRPRPDEAFCIAGRSAALRRVGPPVSLVTVGAAPYRPEEFAAELGLPLAAALPDDPATAGMVSGETPLAPNRLRRAELWAATTRLARSLPVDAVDGRPTVAAVVG